MGSISMYQASVPQFVWTLQNLAHVLNKAEAHAKERGVEPEVLLQSRLIADMLPLVRHVQIATDMAKNGSARLAGVDPVKVDDEETSFAQLQARIAWVIEYVRGFRAEQIDGSETRPVSLTVPTGGTLDFNGLDYLQQFVLPNLFFHATTAYAILRKSGAPLGKLDFLGAGITR